MAPHISFNFPSKYWKFAEKYKSYVDCPLSRTFAISNQFLFPLDEKCSLSRTFFSLLFEKIKNTSKKSVETAGDS